MGRCSISKFSRSHPSPFPAATRVILVTALGAAVALDVGVRGGVTNAFVAAGCALVVLVLLHTHHQLTVGARGLLLASLLPIGMLVLRSSPWLAASNTQCVRADPGSPPIFELDDRGGNGSGALARD